MLGPEVVQTTITSSVLACIANSKDTIIWEGVNKDLGPKMQMPQDFESL